MLKHLFMNKYKMKKCNLCRSLYHRGSLCHCCTCQRSYWIYVSELRMNYPNGRSHCSPWQDITSPSSDQTSISCILLLENVSFVCVSSFSPIWHWTAVIWPWKNSAWMVQQSRYFHGRSCEKQIKRRFTLVYWGVFFGCFFFFFLSCLVLPCFNL